MAQLTELTLAQVRDGLKAREFSALELTNAYVERMAAIRGLKTFITETPEIAIESAKAADSRIKDGSARPLEGVPLAVKDNFCTKGVRTTAASHILENFVPPYESTVTAKLWEAGAILLGKANMDEFAMGSTSGSSYFGQALNPLTRPADGAALVPGGSSGGSAAAVAAQACAGAIGSDTGGSIRQPASLCGVVGIKPTYGRCSRYGIVAYASSLDQAGPLTRDVKDAAILLGAICGHDPRDSTSSPAAVPDFEALLGKGVKGLTIGIPKEYRVAGTPPDVERVWQAGIKRLEEAGAKVIEISLPHTKYALAAYYIIAMAEASSNLARYDGLRYGLRVPGKTLDEMYRNTRAQGFGAEVRRRILIGTYVLSAGYYDAYYLKAQKVRSLIRQDFLDAFRQVDAILVPTSPTPAFPPGEHAGDPVAMWLVDVFTVTVNLAGLPAISVPGGASDDGLPLGLQVIGRPLDEATVLEVGNAVAL